MAPMKELVGVSSDSEVEVIPEKTKKGKSKPKEKSSKKRKAKTLTEESIQILDSSLVTSDAQIDTEEADSEPSNEQSSDERPAKKRKSIFADEIEVDVTLPEPPSKKALRRLKKGKPLPSSKSGAESTPEPEPKKSKSEVEKRSEHGVWIGNLAFHTSKEDLRKFFVEKSDLTEELVTRIHMPGPNDKKSANHVQEKRNGKVVHNKGFAYVDFGTAAAVTECLELSEQLLGGRRVLIKDNKSFKGRPEKTKEESRNDGKPPSRRVFLGNLPFDATEETVQAHFEKCGTVESIKMATFEDSGKCKGFAWIVFEELEAAQSAVRGFAFVEEEISDSEDGSESDSGSDSDEEKVAKPKNTRKQKVWCNRFNGRPLRMEFAEDAQVRYKKRYGKDGTKNQETEGGAGKPEPPVKETEEVIGVIVPKAVEYRKDYAPRLTGGIVESKGKKVTF
ncbi:putative RNA-binding protein rnp24 [Amylocarpus encephaloides]|uniref:RNA-binding protein rnp24 n=1 Tax=Amylocarpus encephaloides TaxID=45428 RepID=A0A9P8C5X9_9HELO|nr:putative RNA-binding protein rnp24 [Amylocarpus encephaloides]